jgi:GNAT superfamily N-acetyltransferase
MPSVSTNPRLVSEPKSHPALERLRIERLVSPAAGFEPFTFPRYRPLLAHESEEQRERLAVGAWLNGAPVGLAFLSRPFGENERELLSIMVSNGARRLGIGRSLLTFAESLARDSGTRRLRAFHSTRLLAVSAYEGLMRQGGWSTPHEHHYRLAGKARWALQAASDWDRFLKRLLRQGFSTSTWSDMTASDRDEIAALLSREIPEEDRAFNPLLQEERRDALPALSLLLRREGRVVGWLLCSAGPLPGVFHYSQGYVLPSFQNAGWLIAGLLQVCRAQAEAHGPDTLSVFETSSRNRGMRRFMERQAERYEGWTDARLRCEKTLDV